MITPSTKRQPLVISGWLSVTLLNLLIAVSIGALLRYAFVTEIAWLDFKKFLHAHSHVAMLGWGYLTVYTFLIYCFLSPQQQSARFYQYLFWLTQGSVLGMLICFPLFGYASLSIFFSSLQVVFSYIFTFRFLKDLKANAAEPTLSQQLIKTALFFQVLSTFALWAMAPIMALDLRGSGWYHMAIQFYLHFQFNGWFIFSILGLFFKILEEQKHTISNKDSYWFYRLLVASCFLTYALAIAWAKPNQLIFWVNSLGVFLQFAALVFFLRLYRKAVPTLRALFQSWHLRFFQISLLSFTLKILIQTAVLIPYIAVIAYTVRNFVIGFIHLLLLGVITHFLIAFGLYKKQWQADKRLAKLGLGLFVSGFILSEILLFFQGLLLWQAYGFLPYYYESIFAISALMPLGLGLFWLTSARYQYVSH